MNVSAAQLRDTGFAVEVQAVLRRHGLPPARLVVEVTESVLVEPEPQTLANLIELRRAGVIVALDDFGTGYSSLSYLGQFPVDVLKLDGSFLAGIDEHPGQARLVAGIIGLGHSLGMRVVADGIERPAQLAHVHELGADLGQGYLLAMPMTADTLAARLTAPALGLDARPERPGLRLIS